MTTMQVEYAEQIEAANRLIVEESTPTINRMIQLASGDLCEVKPDGTRVYYTAPDLICIEYLINRALGTPGARPVAAERPTANDIEDAMSDIANELQHLDVGADTLHPEGPFRLLLSERATLKADWHQKRDELEERIVQFLPTAIERLTDLCSGVTVRKESNGHTRYHTYRPNRRAIEHLSKRMQCSSQSIMDTLKDDPGPDLTLERIAESLTKLTTSQLISIVEGNVPPEVEKANLSVSEPDPPAYYAEAHRRMAAYLPTAISNIKTLAAGATSTILTDTGDRHVVTYPADVRANIFLINRFIGQPTCRFAVKDTAPIDLTQNAASIALYSDQILTACTAHPLHAQKETEIRTLLTNLASAL